MSPSRCSPTTSPPTRSASFASSVKPKLLASLNHTNIATIHGSRSLTAGASWCSSSSRASRSRADCRGGRCPSARPSGWRRRSPRRWRRAHAEGIIHRDLKPANVLITPEGHAKVAGLRHRQSVRRGVEVADTAKATNLTAAGSLVGTPAYMSPEQVRGGRIDAQADIWAFGCLLYEALVARAAFARETLADTMAAIIEGEPDWGKLPRATPLGIRTLLARCVNKEPELRLGDIADARIELEQALRREKGVAAAATSLAFARSRRALITSAGVLLALLVFLVAANVGGVRDRLIGATVAPGPTSADGVERSPAGLQVSQHPRAASAGSSCPSSTTRQATRSWIRSAR